MGHAASRQPHAKIAKHQTLPPMPDYAPIINDYKLSFARRRLLESLLGGVRLVAPFNVPWIMRITQLLILVVPAAVGVALGFALPTSADYDSIAPFVLGGSMLCVACTLALLTAWSHRRESDTYIDSRGGLGGGVAAAGKGGHFADEDEDYDFDSALSYDTLRFLCPKRHPFRILLRLASSFCLGAGAAFALAPVRVAFYFPSAASIVVQIFGWFAVCTAFFAVAAHPPTDPAQFRLSEWAIEQSTHLTSIYICACALGIYITSITAPSYSSELNQAFLIVLVVLPWPRLLGAIPQIDALLSWLFEHVNVYVFGGSRSGSDARLCVMLALGAGASAIVYATHIASSMTLVSNALAAFLAFLLAFNPFWGVGWLSRCFCSSTHRSRVMPVSTVAATAIATATGVDTSSGMLSSTSNSIPLKPIGGPVGVGTGTGTGTINALPPLRRSPTPSSGTGTGTAYDQRPGQSQRGVSGASSGWGSHPNAAGVSTAWNQGQGQGHIGDADADVDTDPYNDGVDDLLDDLPGNVGGTGSSRGRGSGIGSGGVHSSGSASVVRAKGRGNDRGRGKGDADADADADTDGLSTMQRLSPLFAGVVLGAVVAGGSVGLSFVSLGSSVVSVVAIILVALWGVAVLVPQWHRPYLFRVIRNPLFKSGTTPAAGYMIANAIRRIALLALMLGSAVLILADQSWSQVSIYVPHGLISAVLLVRSLRHVAQSPVRGAAELVFSKFLIDVVGMGSPDWWNGYGVLGYRLALAAFVVDRLMDLPSRLEFAISLLVTSVTEKKARYRSRIPVAFIVTFLSPITILLPVVLSAVLGAPLLPLMGLPVFLVGFPRPLRMWPRSDGQLASGSDAAYYKHLGRSLQKVLGKSMAAGALGEPEEGSMYLIRHEKQSAWLQVVEKGARHVWLSVRGLELSETSCHHTEGLGLESVFSQARMDTAEAYQGGTVNSYLGHVLTPICSLKTSGYSDSVVSMIGILDNNEVKRGIPAMFFKALLWGLVHRLGHRGFALRQAAGAGAGAVGSTLSPQLPGTWKLPAPASGGMGMGTGFGRQPVVTSSSTGIGTGSKSPLPAHTRNVAVKAFPFAWYAYILGDGEAEKANAGGYRSQFMTRLHSVVEAGYDPLMELAMFCYSIVELLGAPGAAGGGGGGGSPGPEHIVSVFRGNVPASMEAQWLAAAPRADLLQVVLSAYRYAVKGQIDAITLGPTESFGELQELLSGFQSDWHMGVSNDSQWEVEMCRSRPNLFELFKDDELREFKARIVTQQPVALQIGRLNAEATRGFWAALHLELLYFTNDDDERYSIQAHPSLLRNMSVQSASPPLGYPCYLGFTFIPMPAV